MAKYEVTFTQYSSYEVEAETEDEAIDIAYYEFEADMRYPVANTFYDEVSAAAVEE